MSLDDWILSLHVVSSFAMASTLVVYWILIVARQRYVVAIWAMSAKPGS